MKLTKLKGKNGLIDVKLYLQKGRYYTYFPYDEHLKDDIKGMFGSRWDPENTCWHFPKNRRNDFQLAYLMGLDPYQRYDCDIVDQGFKFTRPLFPQQKIMLDFMFTRRECIVAAEMGLGKTLAGIELIERAPKHQVPWWVGPKMTLSTVRIQFRDWGMKEKCDLMTYDGMKKRVDGPVPNILILDESTWVKSPSSQRTKDAIKIANRIREEHGDEAHIILFSGRPAPNTPSDWWAQAEIACPGFLREGKFKLFEERLCLKKQIETMDGGSYPKIITWWDDPKKCRVCGIPSEEHKKIKSHVWVPSVDEISKLDRRLDGLVLKLFLKDYMDYLPKRKFTRVYVKPQPRTLMVAKQLANQCTTAGELLYKTRALSDGYLVEDKTIETGSPCPQCNGDGEVKDVDGHIPCGICHGSGKEIQNDRTYKPITSPKIKAFCEILDQYWDDGRLIAWAPLHGTMELLRNTALKRGWNVLRFDGKKVGFEGGLPEPPKTQEEMIDFFQNGDRSEPCLFVGNPDSAGTGMTLTASAAMVFYSNSWRSREQPIARIIRPGSRGANIIDIIHMPVDELIVNSVDNKEKLQDMSLGFLREQLEAAEVTWKENQKLNLEAV